MAIPCVLCDQLGEHTAFDNQKNTPFVSMLQRLGIESDAFGFGPQADANAEPTGAGLTRGIIGLTNVGQPRKPDQWGALRAWGWGASRALDYLETVEEVDSPASASRACRNISRNSETNNAITSREDRK